MCFSASASFIAGTALSVVGVATVRLTTRRAEIPFAAIPLLFGIQQIIEGLIWLSFHEGSALPNAFLTYAFSVFSHLIWPVFVPFAVGQLEGVSWRRKALTMTQIGGVAVALYLMYFIVRFPVMSRVLGGHIVYESPHFFVIAAMLVYLVSACGGCLLSSSRIIQVFGALLLVSFIAAYLIHVATLLSMWCFFAAVLSFIVYVYFVRLRTSRVSQSSPKVAQAR